jgi:thiamine-monophosphate kinase
LAFVEHLRHRVGPVPRGEVWVGDDAAVVSPPTGPLLVTTDGLVEGVHFDLALTGADDAGWKALAVSVSDVAAMGGRPLHALVAVAVPRGRGADLHRLYEGLGEAATALACPIVGGDLSGGPTLVVTVTVTGTVDGGPAPVLRSGARPGDGVFVTGPLGAGAAGLRRLRAGGADGDTYRRPQPRVAEGTAARLGGATAMLDLSDGLAIDLRRLVDASGVGVVVDDLPVAAGATPEDAVAGGEDYELLFTAGDVEGVRRAFEAAGLAPALMLGRCTDDPGERRLGDRPLPEGGWEHRW